MSSAALVGWLGWRWRLSFVGFLSLLVAAIVVALAWGGPTASSPSVPRPAAARAGLSALPLAARGAVSTALGGADHAYGVRGGPAGLSAVNAAQRLRLGFNRRVCGAVRFFALSLELAAVG